MWIAKKVAQNVDDGGVFSTGTVSISGKNPAVVTDGEIRNVSILSQGRVFRVPKVGEEVFLYTGGEGEKILLGSLGDDDFEGLASGDVVIKNGLSSITLKENGIITIEGLTVELSGLVTINGLAQA